MTRNRQGANVQQFSGELSHNRYSPNHRNHLGGVRPVRPHSPIKRPTRSDRTEEANEAVVPSVSVDDVLSLLLPPPIAVKKPKLRSGLILGLALIQTIVPTAGCHRQFYRKQADQEVSELIREKACTVARPPETRLGILPDRRSRMFNPFDPDFQPAPLDDPASNKYMQCVDGRRGYPMWDAAGQTNITESPDWWQFLPLDENGVLVLNADTAVQLALLHSPDYQQQLEQLYLSALDVSSERFRFDTQFFGGARTFLTADGRRRNGGSDSSTRLEVGPYSTGRRNLALQRSFATGGELVAGVANSIVWELSGPNAQSASTVLDFSLIQPLLRNAGRDRVLERLTLSERRLLSNVRAFERYRRSFYLNITVGRSTESNVQRSGGVFGVGLSGFTGLGGGFAGLTGGGGGAAGFGGVPQAGGLLGLLQDQLQIQNLEENIARLSENLLVLENTLVELLTTIPDDAEAIVRQRLQVAQARSALLSSQSQLVQQKVGYQTSLDRFLVQLGLPPYICVRIDDPILKRFELIDRELRGRREQLVDVRTNVGALNVSLLETAKPVINEETGLPESTIEWTPKVADFLRDLKQQIDPLADFRETLLEDDLPRVKEDLAQFIETLPDRRSQNESLYDLYEQEKAQICTLLNIKEIDESIFEIEELDELSDELADRFTALQERLESYGERIQALDESIEDLLANQGAGDESDLAVRLRDEIILESQDLLAELGDDVLAVQLIQARARVESVLLPEIEIDPAEAFQIARVNRRDWANARASLVDSWRLIEFNADDLESSLDVVFSGDVQNVGNNPFALRGDTGRLRVGLQWDAPITRLQERNTYRQSLIEFDRAKRSYYQYEDGIWSLMRSTVRQLQQNRLNFELGRQAVRIAAAQIELNEDIRLLRDARGLNSGPTAAQDTIRALDALLASQNQLLNIYVNYEVVRRGLYFDLGVMDLTPDGLWMDPGELDAEYLLTLPGTKNPNLCGCCEDECCIPIRRQPLGPNYGYAYGAMLESGVVPNEVIISDVPVGEPVPVQNDYTGGVPMDQPIQRMPQPISVSGEAPL
ncbi:hypothetical protein Mal65_35080 [Crateriforma conspicua]|nr:hypothetical protein Mal65_35080 [Crateriforma conspicua]